MVSSYEGGEFWIDYYTGMGFFSIISKAIPVVPFTAFIENAANWFFA